MEVRRAGGGIVLRNTGGRFQRGDSRRKSSFSRFRPCRWENRKERLPFGGEPLETVTYVTMATDDLVYAARRCSMGRKAGAGAEVPGFVE